MSELLGWVTFKQLADDIILANGYNTGQYLRVLNFLVKGYLDLRLHVLSPVKTVTLAIDSNNRSVALPDNFYRFVSIGTMYQDYFNKFLPKDRVDNTTFDCGVEDRQTHNTNVVAGFDTHYLRGYYTIDLERKRILIDAALDVQEVILNYTPTGIKRDGETLIPRMCEAVVRAYAEWQMQLRDGKGGDKILFKQQYLEEHNKFMGLQYNTDDLWEEYYKYLRNNYKY